VNLLGDKRIKAGLRCLGAKISHELLIGGGVAMRPRK
jgi:hypothetical protein